MGVWAEFGFLIKLQFRSPAAKACERKYPA
jgi:hypothetical protein